MVLTLTFGGTQKQIELLQNAAPLCNPHLHKDSHSMSLSYCSSSAVAPVLLTDLAPVLLIGFAPVLQTYFAAVVGCCIATFAFLPANLFLELHLLPHLLAVPFAHL